MFFSFTHLWARCTSAHGYITVDILHKHSITKQFLEFYWFHFGMGKHQFIFELTLADPLILSIFMSQFSAYNLNECKWGDFYQFLLFNIICTLFQFIIHDILVNEKMIWWPFLCRCRLSSLWSISMWKRIYHHFLLLLNTIFLFLTLYSYKAHEKFNVYFVHILWNMIYTVELCKNHKTL